MGGYGAVDRICLPGGRERRVVHDREFYSVFGSRFVHDFHAVDYQWPVAVVRDRDFRNFRSIDGPESEINLGRIDADGREQFD